MAEGRMADPGQSEPPERLSITSTVTDGIRVLTLAGEIDFHTGDRLQEALAVAGPTTARTVVDLDRVTFMDSSGINVFIAAHHALSASGGWLRLAAPTEHVLRTLQLVGLDTVIDCRPTLSQALAA
ncbi:STAS domain-containing protein [Streptomyces thermolilacinus]|uniref:STAS domain-containing protein n=1 Tax=Streptomyces thermolilacinus TaxID=285540 RepID=UPI00048E9B34|nr:STAS domain-containing protein [Streptomyces thermolilacinus]